MTSNTSRSAPPANTGSALLNLISNTSTALVHLESRFDPFVRPAVRRGAARSGGPAGHGADQSPAARTKAWRSPRSGRFPTKRPTSSRSSTASPPRCRGSGSRAASSAAATPRRTASCRGEFVVHDGLPEPFRRGIFAEPGRRYQAWVRFSGPGPYVTPDIEDVGFMSISIKLMGVPGPKLMDEEQHTQDLFGVSPPTFVTPDTKANAHLQSESVQERADLPLPELHPAARPRSRSCRACGSRRRAARSRPPTSARAVPAGRGPGDAVLGVADTDDSARGSRACRCARPTTTCATRWWRRWPGRDVALDFRIQLQTDPHLMPIENAGVLWPERLSPRVSVATLRLPKQTFDSPAQMAFARRLSYNPWHCDPRAPPARQPEPRPPPDVLRAVAAAAHDERRAALRADRRRGLRVRPRHDPAVAVHVRAGRPGPRGRTAGPPRTDDRRARPRPPGRPARCRGPRLRYDSFRAAAHPRRPDAGRRRRSTAGRRANHPLSLAFAGEVDGDLDAFFAAVAERAPRDAHHALRLLRRLRAGRRPRPAG